MTEKSFFLLYLGIGSLKNKKMIAWFLIPAGIYILLKADKVVDSFTGQIPFAEKYLGTGGTYTFIKLFGLFMSIFAFMHITGGLEWFIAGTIGKLIPGFSS